MAYKQNSHAPLASGQAHDVDYSARQGDNDLAQDGQATWCLEYCTAKFTQPPGSDGSSTAAPSHGTRGKLPRRQFAIDAVIVVQSQFDTHTA
jgi:hypothetical protein